MLNDKNNFAKRTVSQVRAIATQVGVTAYIENAGDGRSFIVGASDLKTRVALKRAGFILITGTQGDKAMTIKTF